MLKDVVILDRQALNIIINEIVDLYNSKEDAEKSSIKFSTTPINTDTLKEMILELLDEKEIVEILKKKINQEITNIDENNEVGENEIIDEINDEENFTSTKDLEEINKDNKIPISLLNLFNISKGILD